MSSRSFRLKVERQRDKTQEASSVGSLAASILGRIEVVPEWLNARLEYLRRKAKRHRAEGRLADAQACELEAKYHWERWRKQRHEAT